jgi:hypothetical protein
MELLHYNPDTGIFTRLKDSGSRGKAGKVSGTRCLNGYLRVGVGGEEYYAHRLAWLYMTGEWPMQQIDHIDGVRSNNRFSNLRCADPALNGQNQRRAQSDSLTGVLGVTKKRKRFRAQIAVGGVNRALGTFDTPELAHAAYIKAKRELHPGCTL